MTPKGIREISAPCTAEKKRASASRWNVVSPTVGVNEVSDERACLNTDRELWRESDSYYAPSIHVTDGGGIGINVGGHVIVMTVRAWHQLGVAYLEHTQEHAGNPKA